MCRPTKRPKPTTAQQPMDGVAMVDQQPNSFGSSDFKCPDIIDTKPGVVVAPNIDIQQQSAAAAAMEVPTPTSKQTFVFTTYQMVSDPANKAAVGFDSTGTLIQIRDATLFGEHVLPKYFRHRNVTSFYRQLNSYGFRTIKTRSVEVAHTFVCDLFRRDRPDLLPLITRKKAAPPPPALAMLKEQQQQQMAMTALAAIAAPAPQPVAATVVPTPQKPAMMAAAPVVAQQQQQQPISTPSVMKMIQELQEFQQNQQMRAVQLEENIRRLSSENSKILQEGEQVISNMQDMVKNQQRVIQSLFGNKASDAFEAQLKSGAEIPQVLPPMPKKPAALSMPPPAPVSMQMPLPSPASLEMDLFTNCLAENQPDMFQVEDSFVPGDDLLELETLLAFDDDELMF